MKTPVTHMVGNRSGSFVYEVIGAGKEAMQVETLCSRIEKRG